MYFLGFISGVALSALCVVCARNDKAIREQRLRIDRVESALHAANLRDELQAELESMLGGAE